MTRPRGREWRDLARGSARCLFLLVSSDIFLARSSSWHFWQMREISNSPIGGTPLETRHASGQATVNFPSNPTERRAHGPCASPRYTCRRSRVSHPRCASARRDRSLARGTNAGRGPSDHAPPRRRTHRRIRSEMRLTHRHRRRDVPRCWARRRSRRSHPRPSSSRPRKT